MLAITHSKVPGRGANRAGEEAFGSLRNADGLPQFIILAQA
jgi:hypothetical protein